MAKASSTLFAVSCSASARFSFLRHSESLKPSVSRARFAAPMAMAAASAATAKKLAPAVIVGGGRVGRALQEMGNGEDLLVKRGEAVPVDFEGPILVCTRNDDLDAVLEATPQSRWKGRNFHWPEELLVNRIVRCFRGFDHFIGQVAHFIRIWNDQVIRLSKFDWMCRKHDNVTSFYDLVY